MPKHGHIAKVSTMRQRNRAQGAKLASRPMLGRDLEALAGIDRDLVHHHEYVLKPHETMGRFGKPTTTLVAESEWHGEEDRGFVRVSPVATMTPQRRRGVIARDWSRLAERGLGRRDFWDTAVERSSGTQTNPMVANHEVRTRAVNALTGAKNGGATDALAAEMHTNVQRNWDRHQASYRGATRA
jgi:hypothetical protein